MFNEISWQSYWVAIALSAGIYYFLIIFLYYRKDMVLLLSKRQEATDDFEKKESNINPVSEFSNQLPLFEDNYDRSILSCSSKDEKALLFQSLLDELRAFFSGIEKDELSKDDLINSLRNLFKKYTTAFENADQFILTQLILVLSEDKCSCPLSAEEVRALWPKR